MFGKFGAIVIIALSGAIIAGLILRPSPDLPPAMSLGVPDNTAAPVNTLEPTDDNQDKKPAEIVPVTGSVDSSVKTSEEPKKDVETETEKPSEPAAEETKSESEQATTEAAEKTEPTIEDKPAEDTKKTE